MVQQLKTAFVALTLALALPVQAGEGTQYLERFLGGLETMRADFIQSVLTGSGEVKEESEGELLVSRPGRFRLAYEKPYEQLYVADGEQVWMYDRDLEQVTVRTQGDALGSTPALLLSGTAPLEESFAIEELGFHEGFHWLELTPKAADAGFDYIRLALEPGILRAMEMGDGLGQTTRLYLRSVERNPTLDRQSFEFTPPPGVDVIGEAN